MPSDRYYEEMYEAEDRYRYEEQERIRAYYDNMFRKITDAEKLDFLLAEFINNKLRM